MRVLGLFRLAALAGVLLLTVAATGCVHHDHYHWKHEHAKRQGPPPWAPAHGYRHHHHQGVELVFDSGLGVYVVPSRRNHYFHHDHFYRFFDGHWHVSGHIGGPWRTAAVRDLPPGLRKHHGKPHPGRGHGKHKKKR